MTSFASLSLACATSGSAGSSIPGAGLLPEESALADLRQLTFGGENAEAYFGFEGNQVTFQARKTGEGCDRIYRMTVLPEPAAPTRVSSGRGATTCAHLFPGGGELLFASTHLAGPACPPRPDMSKGYVWALHPSYDIFAGNVARSSDAASAAASDTALRRLTETPGYDAEGTVCGKDGSIVFTSVRDGDLELYRMDRDGRNVRRLTHTPGYDGGAFFNADCTKIVWRASRPRPGKELDDYRGLLAQNLVRPGKLELWIGNADGSDAMQITYLDAATFAPSFHPRGDLILFSSNYAQTSPREFDLWAIRPNGTGLRRITHAPGFDGFPHFAPDGQHLMFSSNRATPPGKNDTNLFLARWVGANRDPAGTDAMPAERIYADIAHLAAPELAGRGLGSQGLEDAGAFLEERLATLGLEPAGDQGSFRQRFPVTTAMETGPQTRLHIAGKEIPSTALSVLGFSKEGRAEGPMVLAGYGVVSPEHGLDDYASLDVRGKVVLVRRFAPELETLKDAAVKRRLGDLHRKAFLARERGARALLVVDLPPTPSPRPADWAPPAEDALLKPEPETHGDAGIPVVMLTRAAVAHVVAGLEAPGQKAAIQVHLEVGLVRKTTDAFNVVGRIPAGKPTRGGPLLIGAHYDHLGLGGRHSLAPDRREPHLGADDNASGTATVLEIARALYERRAELNRDVIVILFSAEESGLLGSTHYTRSHADGLTEALAMLNLDMVGRLRDSRLEVLGTDTAAEWLSLVPAACLAAGLDCKTGGDGHGPSDQAAFYAAGVPVLHFFTGTHADYHKPSDTPDRINAAGAAQIAHLVQDLAIALDAGPKLAYRKSSPSPERGDARSFGASLGTIPDYGGPPDKRPGVLLGGVRAGGGADKAGMRRGDVLVRLGTSEIRSVEDLMFVLNAARPGQTVRAVVIRDGRPVDLDVTFEASRRPQ